VQRFQILTMRDKEEEPTISYGFFIKRNHSRICAPGTPHLPVLTNTPIPDNSKMVKKLHNCASLNKEYECI